MKKGFFITVEGGEGSGKGTQVEFIKKWLTDNKIEYIFTREPGGTKIGEDLRTILKHADYIFNSRAELLIFNAARAQLVEEVIRPALNAGKVVVSDRFHDSSLAYQGNARGLGFDNVLKVCSFAMDGCDPDLTIWLDIDPEVAFKRKGGADANDRFEQSGLDFHRKVREG
jgi:dTMP kinase